MADFTTQSPDRIIASWNNINITGYADDTFIEIERDEDGFTFMTGALGDTTRVRSLNRSGKVTFTLMALAPVNDLLADAAQEDEDTGEGYGPLQIVDLNGTMLVSAANAWISKRPKIERAREATTVQWVLQCADLVVFEGGGTLR